MSPTSLRVCNCANISSPNSSLSSHSSMGCCCPSVSQSNIQIGGRYYAIYRDNNCCELTVRPYTFTYCLIDYDIDAVGSVPVMAEKGTIQLTKKTLGSNARIGTICTQRYRFGIGTTTLRDIDEIKNHWDTNIIYAANMSMASLSWNSYTSTHTFKICKPTQGTICQQIEYLDSQSVNQAICTFTRVKDDLDWRTCDQDTLNTLPHYFQILRTLYNKQTQTKPNVYM